MSLRPDVEALAAMARGSAGPGERAAAAWLADRIGGAVEPYRYQGTYTGTNSAHMAAGLLAARRHWPWLALAALVSLELEGSGRRQWLRRLLPGSDGANVVRRIRGDGPTLVVHAHHDAARTGLIWHPSVTGFGAERNLRRQRIDGFHLPTAALLALAAAPWRPVRALAAAGLAAGIATQADVATAPVVPGASDNATGVAALIALAEDPPAGLDLWLVSAGSEESGMGGMAAFLREHRDELDPRRTLFLSLDTLGAGTPIVLWGEGVILTHRYAHADLDLADAAADAAGLERPQRWRIGGWTDAILARFAGFRAISLLSMGPGTIPHYHHPTDTPEHVDWDCAERCLRLARAIAAEWVRTAPASGR